MLKKIIRIVVYSLLLNIHNTKAVIIFTYKFPDDSLQYSTDFSLGSNRIDEVREIADDDFFRQGSFGTDIGQATGSLMNNQSFLLPSYDQDYLDFFYRTITQPSPLADMRTDNFNLYSGTSFQLSSLPSDFGYATDLFKPDPQLVTLIDYYIDNVRITPGQRIVITNTSCAISIITKDNLGYGGIVSTPTRNFRLTCPSGKRVEFDIVKDITSLPSNQITANTKGCVITNNTLLATVN